MLQKKIVSKILICDPKCSSSFNITEFQHASHDQRSNQSGIHHYFYTKKSYCTSHISMIIIINFQSGRHGQRISVPLFQVRTQ